MISIIGDLTKTLSSHPWRIHFRSDDGMDGHMVENFIFREIGVNPHCYTQYPNSVYFLHERDAILFLLKFR